MDEFIQVNGATAGGMARDEPHSRTVIPTMDNIDMIKDMVLELIVGVMGVFIPVDLMPTSAKARGKSPSFSE